VLGGEQRIMWGSFGAMSVADKLVCLQLLDHLKEKHHGE